MDVRLGQLMGMQDSPLGLVETESLAVWRVDVFDEVLPNGMLHVGTIGRHDGANFCANHSFSTFTPEQQAEIVTAVKLQHGGASPLPPVELPEDIAYQEEDEYEEDDDPDDTDLE